MAKLLFCITVLLICLSACDDFSQKSSSEQDKAIPTDQASTLLSNDSKHSHLLLGTGSVQGLYFPIGGVICRLVNRHKSKHNIRCSLESTGGSIYNLRELREGNFDLVVSQSDWQFHAYNGTSTFKKEGANPQLRAVFALEADPIALIVPSISEVNNLDDLAGAIVSFGYSRSLQHRIMNDLLEVKGWSDSSFKEVKSMSDIKQIKAICQKEVDAILLLMSSLNDYQKEVESGCELKIIPIEGQIVQKVIENKPYYRTGIIGKDQYFNSPDDIMSFGLGATFVATESTSPKAIYHVVKEIVENFKDFQSLHPSLQHLQKKELPYAGISVPLHPGAIRYYKEARLLK